MNIIQAIILGIVQGLTEFIPVSSTAHLIFATKALDLFGGAGTQAQAEQTTAAIAVIQLGTLVAVLIYFARDIWDICSAFIRDHIILLRGGTPPGVDGRGFLGSRLSHDAKLGWLIFLGSIPIGVLGLLFKKVIEGTLTKNLWVIATMMVVIALLLLVAEAVGRKRRGMEDLGLADAIIVGFSQCLALIPGSSRSGSTIMGGLLAGEKRETAARFSFLLSIPAVGASGLLELKEAYHKLPHGNGVQLFVATVVAGVVGYASIWFLLNYLKRHSTGVFIGYRLIVGALILVLLFRGVINPL
jgi:undecaprenyl-diphosphatase